MNVSSRFLRLGARCTFVSCAALLAGLSMQGAWAAQATGAAGPQMLMMAVVDTSRAAAGAPAAKAAPQHGNAAGSDVGDDALEDSAPLDDSFIHSHTRPSYAACLRKTEGNTWQMFDCAGTELAWQDARLNRAYKRAMAQSSASERQALRQAQRQWLKETNVVCRPDPEQDGQAQRLDKQSGLLNRTTNRADELERLVKAGTH